MTEEELKEFNSTVKKMKLTFGIILGFILFALVTVLGISFSKDINFTYIVADCAWQIAEQVIGGLIIGLGKVLIFEPIPELIHKN